MADRLAVVVLVIMIGAVAWRVLSSVYSPRDNDENPGPSSDQSASIDYKAPPASPHMTTIREGIPTPPMEARILVKPAPVGRASLASHEGSPKQVSMRSREPSET